MNALTVDQIVEQSPDAGHGKMAYYSAHCGWWTSFPEDLGRLPPVKYNRETQRIEPNPGGPSLPCCPHCRSVLMEAPLEDFVKFAKENSVHYGKLGIATFAVAHSRNIKTCFVGWKFYEVFVSLEVLR